jgi:hypothetical protein
MRWIALIVYLASVVLELRFGSFTAPDLFGTTPQAALDLWSVQHFMAGAVAAALFYQRKRTEPPTARQLFFFLFLVSSAWELAEMLMEIGAAGPAVQTWFGGVEHWFNRLFIDPAFVILGGLAYQRWRWLAAPMLAGSTLWLTANLMSPSVSSVQEHVAKLFEH